MSEKVIKTQSIIYYFIRGERQRTAVGDLVGAPVGDAVGVAVGAAVGDSVGAADGAAVGA